MSFIFTVLVLFNLFLFIGALPSLSKVFTADITQVIVKLSEIPFPATIDQTGKGSFFAFDWINHGFEGLSFHLLIRVPTTRTTHLCYSQSKTLQNVF